MRDLDTGKSTLDLYEAARRRESELGRSELRAAQERDGQLGKVATVMQALVDKRSQIERDRFRQEIQVGDLHTRLEQQLNDPSLFSYKLWEQQLIHFLVDCTTDFGRYCHEGGDLLDDYLQHEGLTYPADPVLISKLSDIAERTVSEYEADVCDYCNYSYEEDDIDEDDL